MKCYLCKVEKAIADTWLKISDISDIGEVRSDIGD